jgi:hypothetical protein
MRTRLIISALFIQSVGALLLGGAGALKPGVEQQLRAQYAVTRVGANGAVLQAGQVLVVQLEGIKANPAAFNPSYYPNDYKDGKKVTQSFGANVKRLPVGGPGAIPHLQVGDKAYLTGIEIKKEEIVFSVQSCGVCDPAVPFTFPLRAAVAFQFGKGSLEAVDYDAIQGVIAQVFAIDTSPPPPPPALPPTPEQQLPQDQTQQPQQSQQPQPQPPVTINLGDTIGQVVAAMGQPDRAARVANKDIYFYKDMKITFVDGKVSDIQ